MHYVQNKVCQLIFAVFLKVVHVFPQNVACNCSNKCLTMRYKKFFNFTRHILCPKKCHPFYFWNNSVKNKPITITFGTWTPEET